MPKGTEAAKLDRDLFRHASNLVLLKVKSAEVVKVTKLSSDVIEVLFHVPARDEGKREPMMAWICKSGTVQIMVGWPL